ncbi:isoprenylcysteine carboxylmethyltransferase family protein [Myxococcota bacterium]|nr:isoprenylcysteine carboxylmethyltransferase family protein [Myxococcota bacterium]
MKFFGYLILGYILSTTILPLAHHRLTRGSWPLRFHSGADPFQRFIGLQLALAMGLGTLWGLSLILFSPASLHLMTIPVWMRALGWPLLMVGFLMESGSQFYMGKSFRMGLDEEHTELLITGPYHFVRNPVYTGLILSLAGITLITLSPYTIMGAIWMISTISIQTRLEEQHMMKMHGQRYETYARRTGRFFPLLGRFHGAGMKVTA